jgi:MoxR-like ATPase
VTTTEPTQARTFSGIFNAICSKVALAVHGKDDVIRLTVTCLVANGHLLI